MCQWPCPPVWLLKPDTLRLHQATEIPRVMIYARNGRAIWVEQSLTEVVEEEEEEEPEAVAVLVLPVAVPDAL